MSAGMTALNFRMNGKRETGYKRETGAAGKEDPEADCRAGDSKG